MEKIIKSACKSGGHPALSDVTPCRWGGLFFSENQLVHCTNCNKNRGVPRKNVH